jgi:cytochrome P450
MVDGVGSASDADGKAAMSTTRTLGFPFARTDPLEPPPEYAELRAEQPVARATLPSGHEIWLVTRYDDVRRILADPRFSREAITRPDAPRLLPVAAGSKSIFVMDPPEHTRLRKLVGAAFTGRQIEKLTRRVEELAAELLGQMVATGSPADVIEHLAQPLPIAVICEMLGVPPADRAIFSDWTDVMLGVGGKATDEVVAAARGLRTYLSDMVASKQREPADDLLTVLVQARDRDDSLSSEELIAFAETLLMAGYHATTAEIAHAVIALTSRPAALHRLNEHRDEVPAAVEELLRHSQAGGGVGAVRIALEDVRIGDVTVKAGEAVLPSINSANRDEQVFAEPDELNLGRTPNRHLAFGHGIHHCLGAPLGRIELVVALNTLLDQLGEFRLAIEPDALKWTVNRAFIRPEKLPLSW